MKLTNDLLKVTKHGRNMYGKSYLEPIQPDDSPIYDKLSKYRKLIEIKKRLSSKDK